MTLVTSVLKEPFTQVLPNMAFMDEEAKLRCEHERLSILKDSLGPART